jgi:hypothetical protein
MQRPRSGIRARSHGAQRRSGLRFAEGSFAGPTAPTLNAALTKSTQISCRFGAGI